MSREIPPRGGAGRGTAKRRRGGPVLGEGDGGGEAPAGERGQRRGLRSAALATRARPGRVRPDQSKVPRGCRGTWRLSKCRATAEPPLGKLGPYSAPRPATPHLSSRVGSESPPPQGSEPHASPCAPPSCRPEAERAAGSCSWRLVAAPPGVPVFFLMMGWLLWRGSPQRPTFVCPE